jgi:hypothetical protein
MDDVFRVCGAKPQFGWFNSCGRDLRECNHRVLLVNFEMENIRDLEIRAIDQDQIATDNDVRVIRRRRREHHFEFPRAGLHLFLEARRQSSTNH